MTPCYRQLTIFTVVLLLQLNLCFANEVHAPPPMPANTKKAESTPIKTPAVEQDKPDEQQEQFPVPELVIKYKDGAKIEEYRVNGRLRYAKITPKVGPAYYLIDTDGDGRFDKRDDHLDNPPIQQWLLYSW